MKKAVILSYVYIVNFFTRLSMLSNVAFKARYIPGFNKLRHYNGRLKAYAEFIKASEKVPGYKQFLTSTGFAGVPVKGLFPDIGSIPITDKKNYVNVFEINERCLNGKIPSKGIVIDESSGSSGIPTNWIRGKKERDVNHRAIEFGLKNLLGNKPLFIINAFAMGAWATGMNITMGCLKFSKIKSTGPDNAKIINTLKQFGPGHNYVIMGYPPFLKRLTDSSDIEWGKYNITFIFGGESMTEGMRDYILNKGVKNIYSSFGASDLELNIAHENDFTISLRRLLVTDPAIRDQLVKFGGALPMIFQFNPADFFIECNEQGELIITICRPGYTSPKIRYNIYDKAHIIQFAEIKSILKHHNLTDKIKQPQTDLPLLFHYGRSDMTVSFFGSNISPNDIQEVIFNIPDLAAHTNSFYIETVEDEKSDKQLVISLELLQNTAVHSFDITSGVTANFFVELAKINQDFKAAYAMASNNKPMLKFHKYGAGPFENADSRIKTRYF